MSDSPVRSHSSNVEWCWKDESENRWLPQSWATTGCHEPIADEAVPLYAIQYRAGLVLEWSVDSRTGRRTGLPNRERPALRVLYVTADGSNAVVREWKAERESDGWMPEAEFASVIGKAPHAADEVNGDDQERYRAKVSTLYGSA